MIAIVTLGVTMNPVAASPHYCSKTAKVVHRACIAELRDDFWTARANCLNLSDREERKECNGEADDERSESRETCREQARARLEACEVLGEDRYDPGFDPVDFVNPLDIGTGVAANPFFPLIPGTKWVYEGTVEDDEGEEVTETITVRVTDKTKLIEGVTCLVVNDVVEEDGEVIEDTDDWYAQDTSGNVWYCGEVARNFETFEGDDPEDAELVDIEGSWKVGRDGARPGILIHASPVVGVTYRQEMLLGEAEDMAEVVDLAGTESTPGGSCNGNCLVTKEYSPLEPGHFEYKYYVPGVGLILEVDEEGNRVELIEYDVP